MSYSRKVLAALMLLLSVSNAGKMLQNPLRGRLANEMILSIFHKQDQQLLQVFQNLPLKKFQITDDAEIKVLKVSFHPRSGELEDFDFNLSLNEEEFVGLQSDNIRIDGVGEIVVAGKEEPEEFTIDGVINNFQISYDIHGDEQEKILFKGIEIDIDKPTLKIESKSSVLQNPENIAKVKEWISDALVKRVLKVREQGLRGMDDVVKHVPAMSLAPLFALYYGSFMAEKVKFTENYAEYEFTPTSMRLVSWGKIYDQYLREITSDFAPMVEVDSGTKPAIQGIVDENFVNSIVGMFLKKEQGFSIRDILGLDPRTKAWRNMLTTTTIGVTIPSFKEQYGEGRPVDIVLDGTQDFLDKGLEGVTPTSVSIEANGNFAITFNLGIQIIVDPLGYPELGREIFLSLQLKGKLFVADEKHDNRTLVFLPKSMTMPHFKVKNGQGDEEFMEQMLVQSMVGFQLDNIKKKFKPEIIPLKNFDQPREFQCIGFNLTDAQVYINKGFVQVNANYRKLNPEEVDKIFCMKFLDKVTYNPKGVFDKIISHPFFEHPMVQNAQKAFHYKKTEEDTAQEEKEKVTRKAEVRQQQKEMKEKQRKFMEEEEAKILAGEKGEEARQNLLKKKEEYEQKQRQMKEEEAATLRGEKGEAAKEKLLKKMAEKEERKARIAARDAEEQALLEAKKAADLADAIAAGVIPPETVNSNSKDEL